MTRYLTEVILLVHFGYFLFCVGGEAIILIFAFRSRQRAFTSLPSPRGPRVLFLTTLERWVRNRAFRLVHLVAVGIVGVEGAFGVLCPLTVWEYVARRAAGQQVESEIPLLSRIIRSLLYYDFPAWVFTVLYVGFALLVLATYFWVPPLPKTKSGNRAPEG